jgi:hypothetical protein
MVLSLSDGGITKRFVTLPATAPDPLDTVLVLETK